MGILGIAWDGMGVNGPPSIQTGVSRLLGQPVASAQVGVRIFRIFAVFRWTPTMWIKLSTRVR